MTQPIGVYLETSTKRTFAGAMEWPGWCRSGRDASAALQALVDSGARYAALLRPAGILFQAPADVSALMVVEQLVGDATTDFGAPGQVPSADVRPVDEQELDRLTAILRAAWQAFDEAVERTAGKELQKGPRGGGRSRESIIQHVLGADAGYLSALGWKHTPDMVASLDAARQAILDGLTASVRGEISPQGPRGGLRWTPRYFVRRVAWHVIDHTWELEDRARV